MGRALGARLVAIVDDDEALVQMVCLLCEAEGIAALPLTNDEGALPLLLATRPDVVLVDLWVSARGSGFGLIHAIRDDPQIGPIRIVVCSGDVQSMHDHRRELVSLHCELLAK